MIKHISAIILTKNNEKTIQKTLESLQDFTDIVIYDNGSTDKTLSIVQKFSNINLIQGEFKGFGWTKNKAVTFSKNNWVIIIDSDEVIDSTLLQILLTKKLNISTVYQLNFLAFYKDKQIKYCGWNNQKIKRLYNKTKTSYNLNAVHENIITDGLQIELLDGNIKHYSYQSLEQFIYKANTYSTLFAENNVGKKKSSPLKAIFNALYSFIKTYLLKKGFLDGYIGLVIAFTHMTTNFFKYMKLYELNKGLK